MTDSQRNMQLRSMQFFATISNDKSIDKPMKVRCDKLKFNVLSVMMQMSYINLMLPCSFLEEKCGIKFLNLSNRRQAIIRTARHHRDIFSEATVLPSCNGVNIYILNSLRTFFCCCGYNKDLPAFTPT